MPQFGLIQGSKLLIVPEGTPGSKPVVFADIPEFDQVTQAVYQLAPADRGEDIYMGVEIRYVELDEGELEQLEELEMG